MNKRERVLAAFRRQPVDRVPVSFWRHFPVADQSAAGLAQAVAGFHRAYDFDLVKVTPASDYFAVDWGLKGEYRGSREGVREVLERPIRGARDWDRLGPLDAGAGSLGQQLDALRLLSKDIAGEAPILETIFSPLTTARKLAGDRWRDDLRRTPEALHSGLAVIARSTAEFIRQALRAGADGIFFATQVATRLALTDEEHRQFGERYDREVFAALGDHKDYNLLHLHGEDVRFELAGDYTLSAVNWHDRRTAPKLKDALKLVAVGLVGGVNELTTMADGTPTQVAGEVEDAIAQTKGLGLMVGAGCVIRIDTPEENLRVAVATAKAVRGV